MANEKKREVEHAFTDLERELIAARQEADTLKTLVYDMRIQRKQDERREQSERNKDRD